MGEPERPGSPDDVRAGESAAERTARLLISLGVGRPSLGLSLTELALASRLHKTTARRLLTVLQRAGLVDRDPDGRYHIGLKMIELGSAYLDDLDLVEQARPSLENLSQATGETVHLATPTALEVVYVDKIESAQSLRMVATIGSRNPLYCTALGKAILAWAGETTFTQVVEAGLDQRTPNTLVDPAALRSDIAEVRSRGYSIDREENKIGVRCVAAEVRDRRGRIVGAISVSGPAIRFSDEVIEYTGRAVRMAAEETSRRLGFQPLEVNE